MRTLLLLAVLALLGPAGCVTIGHLQAPETAGKGELEVGIEPSWYQRSLGLEEDIVIPSVSTSRKVVVDGEDLNEALGLREGVPNLSAALRYGVADRLDLGLRLGTNGVDLLGKVQLTPRDLDEIVVSVTPSMGGLYLPLEGGAVSTLNLQLGVLVGMKLGPKNALVFGPRIQSWQAQGTVDGVDVTGSYLAAGGGVGLALPIGRTVRLLPEVAMAAPLTWKVRAVYEEEIFQSTEMPQGQALLLQAGISVLLSPGQAARPISRSGGPSGR